MPNYPTFENIALRLVNNNDTDRAFIKHLFAYDDVKLFFTLRDDHAADLSSFVAYLSDANVNYKGIHHIIETTEGEPAGLITAELYKCEDGTVAWNIAFAVLPRFRNQGYAKAAVNGLAHILSNFSIERMDLDISLDDEPAEAVAKACGCKQAQSPTGGLVGFMDPDHPEVGMRTRWVRKVKADSQRDEFGNEAIKAHKEKDYQSAITYYKEALKCPCPPGSPFTDALIYSNLAMAYSSRKRYAKAYALLGKAWEIGCRNQTVSKELDWLKANAASEISRKDITDLLDGSEENPNRMPKLKSPFRREMMLDFQKIVKGNQEDISIIMMQGETLFVALGHLIEYLNEGGTSSENIQKIAAHLFKEAKAVTMDLFQMYGEDANRDTKEWYDKSVNALVAEAFGQNEGGKSVLVKRFVSEYHRKLNTGEKINPVKMVNGYLG